MITSVVLESLWISEPKVGPKAADKREELTKILRRKQKESYIDKMGKAMVAEGRCSCLCLVIVIEI